MRTTEREPTNVDERVDERTDETATTSCPECNGALVFDPDRQEVVCDACGLVDREERIDHGPEWRAFDQEQRESRSRVGSPTTTAMHDRGLTTRIDWRNKDGYGRALPERKRRQMQRLRTWDERFRTTSAAERNLKHALGEIDRMASALGVPDSTRETASVMYRRALAEDLLPGRSIEGMATAALYAASRQDGIPRSLDEVVHVSRVGELEVARTYRYLMRELGLEMAPPDPIEYVGRYASKLEVSDETERRARKLLEHGKERGVHSGRHPVGLTAAALYAAGRLTNETLPQGEISAATDVSEVTIRNRYRELLEAEEAASSSE